LTLLGTLCVFIGGGIGACLPGWASVTATAHVAGSLALAALGILTVRTMT
jgi:hypothetical protein